MSLLVVLLCALCMGVGFLFGRMYQALRHPYGDSAIGLECDQQRKMRWAAEAQLRDVAKALKGKDE